MELLTRKEAATYLRISLRKLDSLASIGEVRRVKIGEGQRARVLFRLQDLEAFVNGHLSRESEGLDKWASRIISRK